MTRTWGTFGALAFALSFCLGLTGAPVAFAAPDDTTSTSAPAKPVRASRKPGPAPAPAAAPADKPLFSGLNITAEPGEMPDFVRDSRPAELDYLPITSRGAEPARPILTPDEIRRREADLLRLRSRHDKLAARAPTAVGRSAAPEPVVKKAKTVAPCLLTCAISNRPDAVKK